MAFETTTTSALGAKQAASGPPTLIGLLDADFRRPLPAVVLALLYILSRIPWLGLGYGADPDAWRVAMSARYLATHGSYLPSRLPGYPVHDIAMAALIWGGWRLTNAATLIVSLVGVLVFAWIVRRLACKNSGLLVITFAFLPLLWSTSVATLDYSWALTFLLAAYLCALYQKPALAGLFVGLAGGCRISYLVFALPLALLLWQHGRLQPVLRLVLATCLTWALVFSPVWLRYGTHFWNFYDYRPSWGDLLHALGEQTIGVAPLAVLTALLAASWRELRRLPELVRIDPQINAWALIILLTMFIYIRLPLQTYYLIPAAPFALLLLARLLKPHLLTIACAALLLGGFVDVYTASPSGWRSPEALLSIRPTAGLVLQDYRLRSDRMALVRQFDHLGVPEHSVVAAGFYFPMVAELFHEQMRLVLPDGYLQQIGPLTDNARLYADRDVVFVWLLNKGPAEDLASQGYHFYSLDFSRDERRPVLIPIFQLETTPIGAR